jgi:hypothetical protein
MNQASTQPASSAGSGQTGDGNPASIWPRILLWVTVALVIALTVQQWVSGSGDQISRAIAFAIPMLFPVGMAYWGMRAGLKGPAFGGMAMALLFWIALIMTPGQ